MDLSYEKKYHLLEKSHWWFQKRREMVVALLTDIDKKAAILDVGCAGGRLLEDLEILGFENTYGLDISETAIALCKENGRKNAFVMDGGNTTFEDEMFDVLVASDSLEHIENDEQALEDWFRILKPGGKLIVFVPAYQFLWSDHDVVNHHFRRYTCTNLQQKVKAAGFEIKRAGYWNGSLFPPIAVVRLFQRLFKSKGKREDDLSLPPKFVNTTLRGVLHVENKVVKSVGLPFGVSAFVIVEKK